MSVYVGAATPKGGEVCVCVCVCVCTCVCMCVCMLLQGSHLTVCQQRFLEVARSHDLPGQAEHENDTIGRSSVVRRLMTVVC